jgi:hypothetical protein
MEVNCTGRRESIVVTQALTMLNSGFSESTAQALANRLLAEEPEDSSARLDRAYRLLFGRLPRSSEREAIDRFVNQVAASESDAAKAQHAAWAQLALVLLNSNEFLYVQ